jgi:hypothetical protein
MSVPVISTRLIAFWLWLNNPVKGLFGANWLVSN